jgi:uncharacterized protein DUF4126
MGVLSQILAGFGLSAASGLNAYIPLLLVGLTARFAPWLHLNPPFDVLTNGWVLGALVVLELIELCVDKIPGLDHLNDVVQTFIRPTAGAILFAADAHVITDLNPAIAVILGLVVAFGVHTTKAAARPFVTAGTLGTGNWLVSLVEDVTSFFVSLLAILAPILLLLFAAILAIVLVRWWSNRAARRAVSPPVAKASLKWPR